MRPTQDRVRAAVVGLGPHGLRISDVLSGLPDVRLCGVVDRKPEVLAAASTHLGVPGFGSTTDLWRDVVPDLVCIVTNGPSHVSLAMEAIDNGCGFLLVEKPMGCSVEECDRLLAAASERQVRIAVDHPRRHNAGYRWLAAQTASGVWGRLRSLWVQRPGIGLGCLGTHSFDLVRYLSHAEADRVTAWLDEARGENPRGPEFIDPGGQVVLELSNGARATVVQTEDGAGPMSVEMNFTGARVRLDERLGFLEIVTRDLTVAKTPNRPALYEAVRDPKEPPVRRSLRREVRGILEELLGNGNQACDASHGRMSVEILIAAHLSARRGNVPVALPLEDASDRAFWLPVT